MSTVNIRKQGGAAVVTIPVDVLRQLGVGIGESLELGVEDGVLVGRPSRPARRRRYTLAELLGGVTPALSREMRKRSESWREGPAVGRELP